MRRHNAISLEQEMGIESRTLIWKVFSITEWRGSGDMRLKLLDEPRATFDSVESSPTINRTAATLLCVKRLMMNYKKWGQSQSHDQHTFSCSRCQSRWGLTCVLKDVHWGSRSTIPSTEEEYPLKEWPIGGEKRMYSWPTIVGWFGWSSSLFAIAVALCASLFITSQKHNNGGEFNPRPQLQVHIEQVTAFEDREQARQAVFVLEPQETLVDTVM